MEQKELLKIIEELSALNGTSGDEKDVAAYIRGKLPDGCTAETDNLGNLIVTKKGAQTTKNKLMVAAHMDEVGFIVTYIDDNGLLKFAPVGGIIPAVVFGRQVRFKNGTTGVIAAKPLHLLSGDEKDKQPKISDLYIDIGADSREEAEKLVQQGDCAYFVSEFFCFGDGFVKGKALDDRVGCAIMLKMLSEELKYDCTFVFTVQEEIGTRGATAAAYSVKPDMALVLETTTACDIAGVEGEKKVCELGKGPVVSYMDRATIYDRELYKLAFSAAKELDIPCQTKTVVAGGNDSGAIHKTAGGIRTAAVSLPCRYLHSPACVINLNDLDASAKLASAMLEKMGAL